jgi:hypothetical protein
VKTDLERAREFDRLYPRGGGTRVPIPPVPPLPDWERVFPGDPWFPVRLARAVESGILGLGEAHILYRHHNEIVATKEAM